MALWVEIRPFRSYIGIHSLKLNIFWPKYVRTFEFLNSGLRTFYNFSHVCEWDEIQIFTFSVDLFLELFSTFSSPSLTSGISVCVSSMQMSRNCLWSYISLFSTLDFPESMLSPLSDLPGPDMSSVSNEVDFEIEAEK